MTFPKSPRVIYKKNPLIKVICQLRFPTILAINVKEPNEYQEAIRDCFPQYEVRVDKRHEFSFQKQEEDIIPQGVEAYTVKNHEFTSSNDKCRINLTSTFISLSTEQYTRWEDFIKEFERPLECLMEIYKPAYFTRTGLRYIDAFRRSNLNLEDSGWHELINSFALGFLSSDDISESNFTMNNLETEMALDDGKSNLKIRSNLSVVPNEAEIQYIIDSDFYSSERLNNLSEVKNKVQYLHSNSTNFIRWVIKDKLHYAMEPEELCQ